jgi:crotonobetainyl-CoA:carnitine CoA-transferase CaiB-like acyl-CoA transferase
MNRPLAGVRVIEFANLVAGPYCGMLLADLGADVVKVEPLQGDLARHIGPFVGENSLFFFGVNRGKRSLAVDAKNPSARHLLRELARQADVMVHNLRPGAMERIGLGYQELSALNPGLVYAVISAFGTEGPDADRTGIDLIFQGESGMMAITGADGDPPHKTATTIADFLAGTNAALAIVAALAERGATGRGGLVETSLRDGLIAVQGAWAASYFATGAQPARTGTASPVTAPNQTFTTADGYLNLAIVSDHHFDRACQLLGLEEVAGDPRFGSNDDRVRHREELATLFGRVLATEPTDHWLKLLGGAGLPVGRILTFPEVFSDPQVLHNQMRWQVEHPRVGAMPMAGSPLRTGGAPLIASLPPPLLGEHTETILTELGVSSARLEQLIAQRAVAVG